MKKKSLITGLLVLAGIGIFCVTNFGITLKAYAKEPIKIGVTTDFSGVTAMWGIGQSEIYKMVVKEVNESGGINGRPVKLFILDNGGDPGKLLANLKLLKDKNKVVAVLAGVTTTVNLAAKKWAEQNHIPVMNPCALSYRLWDKEGKSWWFRTTDVDELRSEAALIRAKELGYTKIGYEGTTLAWGTDTLAALKKYSPKYGIEIVGDVRCEPKSRDLSIQAKKLRDTGVEAMIMVDYEAETAVWARALKTIGWKPYVMNESGSAVNNALKNSPPELFEGWEVLQLVDITKPFVKEVWDKHEAYTGKRYEAEELPLNWDAIQILFEAIKLSGNPDDPEAIRDGLYKIKDFRTAAFRNGALCEFKIGKNHLPSAADLTIYVARAGKLVPAK